MITRVLLTTPCPKCGVSSGLYSEYLSGVTKYSMVSCEVCGHIIAQPSRDPSAVRPYFTQHINSPNNIKRPTLEGIRDHAILSDKQSHIQKWTQKEAYRANKESEKCVVCGKKLALHCSVGVLYCKCIEELPAR